MKASYSIWLANAPKSSVFTPPLDIYVLRVIVTILRHLLLRSRSHSLYKAASVARDYIAISANGYQKSYVNLPMMLAQWRAGLRSRSGYRRYGSDAEMVAVYTAYSITAQYRKLCAQLMQSLLEREQSGSSFEFMRER